MKLRRTKMVPIFGDLTINTIRNLSAFQAHYKTGLHHVQKYDTIYKCECVLLC